MSIQSVLLLPVEQFDISCCILCIQSPLFILSIATMPAEEHLSDDYVANLLAKDAKTSNAKYSTYGLQELLPKR